jgi:hypothetical protein
MRDQKQRLRLKIACSAAIAVAFGFSRGGLCFAADAFPAAAENVQLLLLV